jgi:nucleoside-diphosphate-sugar epimerase
MKNKILITGINGFVGKRLAEYLSALPETEIYGLVRRSSNIDQLAEISIKEFFYYEDPSFWKKHSFHAVVHCAGKAHDLAKTSDAKAYDTINFELTKSIFEGYRPSSSNKFIFLSSVKAVADTVDGVLDENAVPNPKTPYGISKIKAENYLKQSISTHSVYIIRPCVIYGPGNKGNLDLLYQLVKRRIPYPLGAYNNERSFLYIDNLCFAIAEIIDKNIPSGIYHAADNGYLSTKELTMLIGEAINKKPVIINLPKFMVNALAVAGNYLHLPLNSERLGKLTENYRVDNQKLIKALGKNLPYETHQALKETFSDLKTR